MNEWMSGGLPQGVLERSTLTMENSEPAATTDLVVLPSQ